MTAATPTPTLRACDAERFAALFRRYGRLVYAVCFKVLHNAELADQATQQVFRLSADGAELCDSEVDLGPWLCATAGRVAHELVPRAASRIAKGPNGGPTAPRVPAAAVNPGAENSATTVSGRLSQFWKLREALDGLPAQDRELLRLRHQLGLGDGEIAARLGIAERTVALRMSHAHRRLTQARQIPG